MLVKLSNKAVWLLLIGFLLAGRDGFTQVQSVQASNARRDILSYVNPFIGTAKSDVFTRWGNEGGTYPGAVAPWGFMQLTPETRADGGYDYGDSSLYFFSCVHHNSGYPGGSGGEIKIMPLASGGGAAGFSAVRSGSGRPFIHQDEKASPGYYRVQFSDDHSRVEATASGRVGWFRFTFPEHVVPRIFVGGMGTLTRTGPHSLQGSHFPVVLRYDRSNSGEDSVKDGKVLRFTASAEGPTVIVLQISVSTVSPESAGKNIDTETAGLRFDEVRERTEEQWRKELSVAGVADSNETKKTIFYTALYHSLLLPWIISDVGGKYRGRDGRIHQASGKNEYGGFSPWDTFRSLHPLLCLLFPDRQQDIVLSMLDIYRQTGHLPTDPMTGNHAVPVIVDSWMKGIRGFDSILAYDALRKGLEEPPFLESDMEVYHQRGYIPSTYPESVTRTVEYAYDDWALGQFAGLVMHQKEPAAVSLKRSYAYQKLFNTAALLLLPRDGDQYNLEPGTTGYKEGDKWVYSFFVPQHIPDLINWMGGKEAFAERLDSALADQTIVFDNETVFHIPYLFNEAGRPDRTQYWIRTIMDKRFSAMPGGLPGNDDLGSFSSWYVLSAMGFYPVCPGMPAYAISSPSFMEMTLRLSNGRRWVIKKTGAAAGEVYVKSVSIDGKNMESLWMAHQSILLGGTMVFEMSKTPVGAMVPGKSRTPVGMNEGKASARLEETDFHVQGFPVAVKEVLPNELFWVRFSVSNKGATGTKIVKLYANGQEIGHKNCLVAAGAQHMDSIGCRLYPYGVVEVRIDRLPAVEVKVVRREEGAGFVEITGLAVRPMLRQGEEQQISFSARNIGGDPHSFYMPVRVNDALIRMDTLLLGPGEKRIVTQEFAVTGEGMQIVQVMDVREKFSIYHHNAGAILLDLLPGMAIGDSVVPDRSGFANQGRIMRVGGAAGKEGQLDGKNGLLLGRNCYVEVPNSPSLDQMGENITMMAWVYPVAAGRGHECLLTKGDDHVLQVVGNGSLSFFAGGWGRGECIADLPADWLGHWHHIAGVCEGSTLRLYIDGIQKGFIQADGRVNLSNTHRWTLGRNEEFPGERVFSGYMDGVKVLEAPLTGEEIRVIVEKEIKKKGRD